MPYDARVYRAFIISPSDLDPERAVVREVFAHWNERNSREEGVVWLPVGYETHTVPELGEPAQDVVTRQTGLDQCDWGIALFWRRLGTPTRRAPSGSAEEVDILRRAGRHVSVYLKTAPSPVGVEEDFQRLTSYVETLEKNGLCYRFGDVSQLQRKLYGDISFVLRKLVKAASRPALSGDTLSALHALLRSLETASQRWAAIAETRLSGRTQLLLELRALTERTEQLLGPHLDEEDGRGDLSALSREVEALRERIELTPETHLSVVQGIARRGQRVSDALRELIIRRTGIPGAANPD